MKAGWLADPGLGSIRSILSMKQLRGKILFCSWFGRLEWVGRAVFMSLMPGVGRTACVDIICVLLWGSDARVVNGGSKDLNVIS